MAGPTESLFSLEIVVDCVEKSLVSCHAPAIAFRLLDFPTLIIRSDEKESPNYLNGFYPIQSGKSCLFKMSKEMLLSGLQSTPLYIMLVDIAPNKTKLLASTTISLTNCFENVLESIQRNGLDVPAVHSRQGVFELYNLMGTQVGSVKLTYRMFSLGGTINGHVQQCISSAENLNKGGDSRRNGDPRKEGQTSNHNQIDEDFEVKDSEHEKDSGNGKETEMFPSSLRCEVETQTYICNKDDIHVISTVGLKENVNITRPPPLYYNRQSTVAYSKAPLQQYRTSSPEKNIDKVFKQTPEKTYKTVAIQTSYSGQRNAEVVPDIPRIENDERAQLADLPLINGLLSELSLAKQSWMNTAAHTKNNNRGLPTTHTQDTNIPALVFHPNKKSLKQKEKVEVPSNRKPILKPRATKPATKGVLIQRNSIKFKKSSLKCGTTKTQKLREALNKKTSHSNNLSLGNIDEEKRPLVNSRDLKKNEKTKLVASEMKATREFGCQVAVTCSDEQGTSENGQKYMPLKTNPDEQLPNIVEKNDDLPPVSGQTYSKDIGKLQYSNIKKIQTSS